MKSTNWQDCQKRQLDDHFNGAGVFSTGASPSEKILAEQLNMLIPQGICLDVGCGILSLPNYMKLADKVRFVGIDPFEGEDKMFQFVKGFAENLPFERETFDGVLFATSLDHIEEPLQALNQAFRVLKPNGYMFIWGSFYNEDEPEIMRWRKEGGMIFNHINAITLEWIFETVKMRLVDVIQLEKLKNKIIIFQK
jgi:ubiquinone/menaquinone biosynthesis C-methylase UbiE